MLNQIIKFYSYIVNDVQYKREPALEALQQWPDQLLGQGRLLSHNELSVRVKIIRERLAGLPGLIDQIVECGQPLGDYLMDTAEAYQEYLRGIKTMSRERGEEIYQYLEQLRHMKMSFFTQESVNNIKLTSELENESCALTNQHFEKVLTKVRNFSKECLRQSPALTAVKETYVRRAGKLYESLKQGRRAFERNVLDLNQEMTAHLTALQDSMTKQEYVRISNSSQATDNSTRRRLSLIMENKSLIYMQLMENMPSL